MPKIEFHKELPEVITIKNRNSQLHLPTISLDGEKEVIVDVSCAASLLRGAHLYGPGVLAMLSNTTVGERVNIYADVQGKCKKGTNVLYESKQKVFIGVGIAELQRYQLFGENVNPRYFTNFLDFSIVIFIRSFSI